MRYVQCSFYLVISLFLSACQRDAIETYRVPKETAKGPMAQMQPLPGMELPDAVRQRISWTTPKGWEQLPPSAMRAGSFRVPSSHGPAVDVSIVPLSGSTGGMLANINRWRGQIQLPPVSEVELQKLVKTIQAGKRTMKWVDFENGQRIAAVIYERGEETWFFKMTGDSHGIEDARPAFLQLLASIRFRE